MRKSLSNTEKNIFDSLERAFDEVAQLNYKVLRLKALFYFKNSVTFPAGFMGKRAGKRKRDRPFSQDVARYFHSIQEKISYFTNQDSVSILYKIL